MRRMCHFVGVVLMVAAVGAYAEEPYSPFKVGLQAGTDVTELIRSAFNLAPMSTIFSIGAQIHITRALSLRPVIQFGTSFQSQKDDLTGNGTPTVSEVAVGGRLDLLWHLIRLPAGSVYVGPSVGYLYDYYNSPYGGGGTYHDVEDSELKAGILFGAQTLIFNNFAFYMESGVSVNKTVSRNDYYNAPPAGGLQSGSTSTYTYIYLNGLTFGFVAYLN